MAFEYLNMDVKEGMTLSQITVRQSVCVCVCKSKQ